MTQLATAGRKLKRRPTRKVSYRTIDFDRELEKGWEAYHEVVGQWWAQQSDDRAHAYAYRKVADYVADLPAASRRRVLDYACGTGGVLTRLAGRLPRAELIALDGSPVLMGVANERIRRRHPEALERVRFIETRLPNFSLPRGMADLIVFNFPHIVATEADQPYYNKHGYKNREDAALARILAESREEDPEEETTDETPEELFDSLMSARVVARNHRHLLKRGGLCVRVDYANSERDDLTDLIYARCAFEEGSLDRPFKGREAEQFFRIVRSSYHRSSVIEDVYHQTRDKSDKEGGYTITLLRAI